MNVGDLVQYKDQRWVVTSFERTARIMTLYNQSGTKVEFPREYDRTHPTELQVLASPPTQWCVLMAPCRSGSGPFVQITEVESLGRRGRILEAWVDWVPSDLWREGGSLFINPKLKLLPGMVLMAAHKKEGVITRIVVPKTFATTARRVSQAEAKKPVAKPEEQTRFSRLLRDDDEV